MEPNAQSGKVYELPDEILLYIFSFLQPQNVSRCGLVCKQWYRGSKESLLRVKHCWLVRKYPNNVYDSVVAVKKVDQLIKVLKLMGDNIENIRLQKRFPWPKQKEVLSLLRSYKTVKTLDLEKFSY